MSVCVCVWVPLVALFYIYLWNDAVDALDATSRFFGKYWRFMFPFWKMVCVPRVRDVKRVCCGVYVYIVRCSAPLYERDDVALDFYQQTHTAWRAYIRIETHSHWYICVYVFSAAAATVAATTVAVHKHTRSYDYVCWPYAYDRPYAQCFAANV